jgi:hypothetical protein
MSVENLSTAISIPLGLLAATTGVLVSYLFVINQSGQKAAASGQPGGSNNIDSAEQTKN